MRATLTLLAVLLLCGPAALALQDQKPQAEPSAGKAAFEAVRKEVGELAAPFIDKYRQAKSEGEKAAIKEEFNSKSAPYAAKFLAIAEQYPKDPVAFDAVMQALALGREKESRTVERAAQLLLEDFAGDKRAKGIHMEIGSLAAPGVGMFLRAAFEKSRSRDIQGQAAMGLARHYTARFHEARTLNRPQADRFDQDAQKHFQFVMDKFADVKVDDATLGDTARNELFEMKFLSVGRVAPETAGQDTDDKKFKLSDYRGKVVVIDFWASWCGPCMAMVPHNRDMVKNLTGKPFALLGVNMDSTKEACNKAAADHQINWRSWFDGGEGPIAKQYQIESIPTIYVIDHKGVIRHKNLRGKELEAAVEVLVKEAETVSGK